jgi:SPP1 family predicted phage head-tail adaptor
MKPFGAGHMTERIALQTNTPSQGATGQPVPSWATAVTVWGSVGFISGSEREGDSKVIGTRMGEFVIRHRSDITNKMRAVWNSINWNIHEVRPDLPEKQFMTLVVSEVK